MGRNTTCVVAGLALMLIGLDQPRTPAVPTPVAVLSGHTGWVTALAWSPDGSILASSSGDYTAEDHTVRLWSADGVAQAVIDNGARTYSLAWSPDGRLLASGTETGEIRLITADGSVAADLEGERGVVYSLDWSPDGSTLAVGISSSTSENHVQLWSSDGTLQRTLSTKYSGGKFYNVGWSPDGEHLIAGAIDYNLWKADGTLVFSHDMCEHCTPAWGMAWSPDSQLWAVGDENGTVYVYALDGELVAQLQSNTSVNALAWSPDGKILAGGNTLWFLDGATFVSQGGYFNGRNAVAWSPDSQLLATSVDSIPEARIVNRQGSVVAVLDHEANRLTWSPDGQLLATGSSDGTIRLWSVGDLRPDRHS